MKVGYLEAFSKTWNHFCVYWEERGPTKMFLVDFINDVYSYCFVSANDILLCLALGVSFTILRYFLTEAVFKPTFRWYKLLEKEQQKCQESAFKLLFYSVAYGHCSYILFGGKYDLFHDTRNFWKGWYKGMPIPQDIYALYVVEAGFYLHSLYATLYMDRWKRDSILVILHHILTILLLSFSFAVRYHKIGLLVLFLHDVNDIILEFSTICKAFKSRNGKYNLIPDIITTVGFACFISIWFYCRLYLYPIKVLYSSNCEFHQFVPNGPFYFFFNIMLWILFGMNVWWFQYILLVLIRAVTGTSRGLEDSRDIPKPKLADATHSSSNRKDNTRGDENGDIIIKEDNKEQFRRRFLGARLANT